MFANIIPINKIPLDKPQFYTYTLPSRFEDQIKIGSLVLIPLYYGKTKGVVLNFLENATLALKDKTIKPVIKLLFSKPLLDRINLSLAEWMSNYYHTPLGPIIKMMIPPLSKKVSLNKNWSLSCNDIITIILPWQDKGDKILAEGKKLTIPQSSLLKITQALSQIKASKKNIFLLMSDNEQEKITIYLKIIEKIVKQKQQALILVPEIGDVNNLYPIFKNYFSDVTYLHSRLKKSEYFARWLKIKKGEIKIIIGTRMSIFTLLPYLGLIIMDQEENPQFKQADQSPRYQTREVVLKLAELTQSMVIFGSLSPSLESYYRTQLHPHSDDMGRGVNWELIDISKHSKPPPNLQIIDMNLEATKKNFSPLSEKLKEYIEGAINKKQTIFLFLNRRGQSTLVTCPDCHYTFRCPGCQLPLVYHQSFKKEKLLCHHCQHIEPLPILCPSCQGMHFRFWGIGTQRIEQEIKKIFPKVQVKRIDKDIAPPKAQNINTLPLGQNHKSKDEAMIIIGTQLALNLFKKESFFAEQIFDLIGIISLDTLLRLPDFKAYERTWQLLNEIISLNKNQTSPILIQTYSPFNYLWEAVAKNDYYLFYSKELEERKRLNYPPFAQLIKLIYQDKDLLQCQKKTKLLYQKLKEIAGVGQEIYLEEPQPCYIPYLRNKYRWQIIIKLPLIFSGETRTQLLKEVPPQWIIDIDPESLL